MSLSRIPTELAAALLEELPGAAFLVNGREEVEAANRAWGKLSAEAADAALIHGSFAGRDEDWQDLALFGPEGRRSIRARRRRLGTGTLYLVEPAGDGEALRIHAARTRAFTENFSGLSHDVNNALAVVLGKVAMARRSAAAAPPELAAKLAADLERVELGASRIAGMISSARRVFASSRDCAPVKVQQLFEDALVLCEYQLRRMGVDLRVSPAGEAEAFCRGPEVARILVALLRNAGEACVGAGDPWIELRCSPGGGELRLQVIDSGGGIAPELVARIGTPYFTTKKDALGLSLFAARQALDPQRGRLEYERGASGASFSVILPLAR